MRFFEHHVTTAVLYVLSVFNSRRMVLRSRKNNIL